VYNLDREKLIILILALPLLAGALFLSLWREGVLASWAAGNQYGEYNTETVYSRCECANCNCNDTGKKLISFKGPDAECEDYDTEEDRMRCYYNNAQASFACPYLESEQEVNDCFEKYNGKVFNYYQGGAGTLVTNQSYTTGGTRMYLGCTDCEKEHQIMTGTDEHSSNVITFRDSSRDVHYGGDIRMMGQINIQSELGGAYFGSDVKYGEKDLGNGVKGQGLVHYDNFNGMNLNGCGDLKVMANHHNLITVPGEERETFGDIEIEKGLEVNGDIKMDRLYFQGRKLIWSQPIRGEWVLYYKTGPEGPGECDAPDLPRDTPPNPTPPLAGMGDVGPSQRYYNGSEGNGVAAGGGGATSGGSAGGGSSSGGTSGGGTSGSTAPPGEASEIPGYSSKMTVQWSGAQVSVDKILQRKFVFSGTGPDYGPSLLFVFSDGQRLSVPNSSQMHIGSSKARKFQPGGTSEVPSMEVYADRGSSPTSVTLYYN
jgi:uncharacterized membrane protein YgcG